jgi:hypothetical protein
MIKRLTDEPTKLVEARPDLSFPTGLQPVLDTALARTPMERYQTVAKFAADVAAVTGRPVARSVPQTDAKTQLLDASGGATQRMSAAKPPPPPRPKKRSLIPIAVGAVVILAAGGAWVALNGGSRANPDPVDTSHVARDTASNQMVRQTGHVPQPVSTPTGGSVANRDSRPKRRIDLTGAGDALNQLLDSIDTYPTSMVRDSARALYDAAGITANDKALAAFVIANTYFKAADRPQGCSWVQRASTLNPSSSAYSRFVREQCS